jgi:hypothetical protein
MGVWSWGRCCDGGVFGDGGADFGVEEEGVRWDMRV